MRTRTALGLGGAALAAAAIASCALAGFDVADEPETTSGGGGHTSSSTSTTSTSTSTSTTTSTSTGAGGSPCGLATYPGPPSVITPEGQEEFVAAFHSIDFGDKSATPPGLDLDGKCTCFGNKVPKGCCQADGPSCMQASKTCDGARGIDNVGAGVFSLISTFLGNFGSDYFSQRAQGGFWTSLIRVRSYNGTPNDGRVEVDIYASGGFQQPPGGVDVPKWDGSDPWKVTDDSVDKGDGGAPDLDHPKWFDKTAYVTDGVLVASLPSSVLRLSGTSAIDVRVSAGFLVAKIVPQGPGAGYALTDGLVVFRWKIADVLYALSSYRDANGKPICTDNPLYTTGRSQLCNLPDINVEASKPTEPCTAVSVGLAFEAKPAKLGAFSPSAPLTGGCPAATDPQYDSCPAQ
jgi:hypothetical protein